MRWSGSEIPAPVSEGFLSMMASIGYGASWSSIFFRDVQKDATNAIYAYQVTSGNGIDSVYANWL
jgi:hypothetical protein